MKLCFAFFILLVTNLASYYCEQISLLGSHYISDSTYKFYLVTDGVNPPATINVNLDTDDNQVDPKTFNDFTKNPIESELTVENSNKYKLKVTSNKCSQSVNLTRISDQSMIFIYFNKPIYKTGEEFKFQVFVLDHKMIPMINHKKMDITIFDSNKNAIRKFLDANGDDFGVYQESVQIADDPNLGNWMIQVEIGDKIVTKSFEVQKYDEGDIEVLIDVPSAVAHEDRKLYMSIYAKNSDDNFVNGFATISLTGSFIGKQNVAIDKQNFKKVDIEGSKTVIILDFSDDLEIRFPTDDMILKFEVEVTEKSSQRSKKAQKEIKLRHKGKHNIQVVRKKYFKPTFKYPIKIRVKNLDGKPDNSFNQLLMEIKYINDNPSDSKKYNINLKNGETSQLLQPAKETKKIILNLEFAGTKHTEEIDIFPTFGVKEYMQVTTSKNTKVNENIRISVNTTEEMEELHLIVFGLQGIVHSDKFPDSIDKDTFEFSFTLTELMKPEARGIVFYVRNGAIIYDEFSVSLGFSIDNSINITASQDGKPNAETEINVNTEKDSKVFLTAIDSNAALLKHNTFEISRNDVYNELAYYLNKKFPTSGRYHFDKVNAYVLEPLVNDKNCGSDLSSRSNFDNEEEDEEMDNGVHQYFPTISYEDNFNASPSNVINKKFQLPNSLSTWRLFGISVHKTKGFTVVKDQPEIIVKNEILAQIEAPSQIRPNEVVRARITAFNFQDSQLDGKITVNIENGYFMDEINVKKNCLGFKRSTKDSLSFDTKLPAKGKPLTVDFLISADQLAQIKIITKVTAASFTHDTEKVIHVYNFNEMRKIVVSSNFVESNGGSNFDKKIDPKKAENKELFFTFHGNLLGPAVNGLEAIFNKSMVLPEEKMLNFATSIIIYSFTKLEGYGNDEVSKKAESGMIKGYQEALPILQGIYKSKDKSQAWFTSFIAGILIDANKYISIDSKIIKDSLNFVKKQMENVESFKYDRLDDLHRNIDSQSSRVTVQSALIACTLLKDENFKNEASKLLNYIKANYKKIEGNYVKAVTAYTLAFNNDTLKAKDILKELKFDYNQTSPPKHLSMYVEILSYLIRTKILFNEDPKPEVDLLITNHRNADGGFYSPYDTVLGLQALYEYTKWKKLVTSNAKFEIGGKSENFDQFDSKTFKVSKGDSLKLSGSALAYANIYYHEEIKKSFNLYNLAAINIRKSDELETSVEFKFTPKSNNLIETNQVVLEIEIPRGYRYVKIVEKDVVINKFKLRNNDTVAVYYINNMDRNKKYKLVIMSSKVYDFYEMKSQVIRIYDYYRPSLELQSYAKVIQDYNAFNCQ